jgi:hypothetical protein
VFASSGGVHLLPELAEVQQLLDLLAGSSSDLITVEQLQQGLVSLGYSLEPSEVLELAQNLGYGVAGTEGVALSQFAASQLDWENIQVGEAGGSHNQAVFSINKAFRAMPGLPKVKS